MPKDFMQRRLKVPHLLHVEEFATPKRPRATVVLVHGIGSSTQMWRRTASELPDDIRIIAVDLLGFGKSPQPAWGKYDAASQATSLIWTLIVHKVPRKSLLIGHSLGALVAIDFARRFPWFVRQLILVSPPIYRPSKNRLVATQQEDILRGVYKILQRSPRNTERALLLAKRYFMKRTNQDGIPTVNITSFLKSLNASIINQDTINHIEDVKVPMSVLQGSLDPLVVGKTLRQASSSHSTFTHKLIPRAGHNVVGPMQKAVVEEIRSHIGS